MRKSAAAILACVMMGPPNIAGSQTTPAVDPELETGIQQAREGDFDAAVITLDAAVNRLLAEKRNPRTLARAYLYLSIAYLGMSQEQVAKARFLDALKTDSSLELSAREFPPRILEFFEQTRKEVGAAPNPSPSPNTVPLPTASSPPSATGTVATEQASAKRGRSKLPLVLGGAALAGVGVALAAGGRAADQPTATPSTVSCNYAITGEPTNCPCTPAPGRRACVDLGITASFSLVSASPPMGSRFSAARQASATFVVNVQLNSSTPQFLEIYLVDAFDRNNCFTGLVGIPLSPGANVNLTYALSLTFLPARCALPRTMQLELFAVDSVRSVLASIAFGNFYTVDP